MVYVGTLEEAMHLSLTQPEFPVLTTAFLVKMPLSVSSQPITLWDCLCDWKYEPESLFCEFYASCQEQYCRLVCVLPITFLDGCFVQTLSQRTAATVFVLLLFLCVEQH